MAAAELDFCRSRIRRVLCYLNSAASFFDLCTILQTSYSPLQPLRAPRRHSHGQELSRDEPDLPPNGQQGFCMGTEPQRRWHRRGARRGLVSRPAG